MYSRFELTVPGSGPVSRDLILTLSNLLRRLAVSERGKRDDIDIGFGVTLFCDPDTLRFSSEAELSAHIPPLAQIDGFHLSVMFNPWHMHEDEPSLLLHIHKPDESASFSITVEAVTKPRAQELALKIADVLAQHTVQQELPSTPEPELPAPAVRMENELRQQTDDTNKYHTIQKSEQDAQRKQNAVNRVKQSFYGIIAGVISSTIAGLILYYWPHIIEFFSELFQ